MIDLDEIIKSMNLPKRISSLEELELLADEIDDQRAYLIGKRYKEEKKAIGANKESIKEQVKQINNHAIPHNEGVKDDKSTSAKIAEQSKVSPKTVRNAEKFADAVDKVAENTGINPQEILSYTL